MDAGHELAGERGRRRRERGADWVREVLRPVGAGLVQVVVVRHWWRRVIRWCRRQVLCDGERQALRVVGQRRGANEVYGERVAVVEQREGLLCRCERGRDGAS